MALISCANLAFGYEGHTVVEGLTFAIETGWYLCIVGENGSGKSTLIKGLLRLMQPSAGVLRIGDGLLANEIGYLPQQTPVQKDFPASVFEVVLSGRQSSRGIKPFYSKEDKRIATENMKRLGIDDLRKHCYRELSGGQQQRALLARALCATKKVLLLDEPAAGLDPIVTQELYVLINSINRETGITVLMVSHDIHSAVKYASHILHLNNRQAFFGTVDEYIETPLGRSYLEGERK